MSSPEATAASVGRGVGLARAAAASGEPRHRAGCGQQGTCDCQQGCSGTGPGWTVPELLLRPHLHEVYLDADRRRRGIPHLSRRELEVLQLASQGYSNADIARILFISVATVRKHMEHIFDRTGVRRCRTSTHSSGHRPQGLARTTNGSDRCRAGAGGSGP